MGGYLGARDSSRRRRVDARIRVADSVEAELDQIDVGVNNAMVTIYASIVDIAPDEFHQVMKVTLSRPGPRDTSGIEGLLPRQGSGPPPEVATDTPSRTIRVTLSSDPKCCRATARTLSAAR
jgi:NAD(P)-dependent dehydrogenase (short-subunit alcohol dehydrogenase family)